ncbi:MAG TPA: hypothetical protein VFU59_00615 [Candidatus Eisenbacteria bacterium]|nr:hypothetical protein [Candidatus Eisenbacteria bacterium]
MKRTLAMSLALSMVMLGAAAANAAPTVNAGAYAGQADAAQQEYGRGDRDGRWDGDSRDGRWDGDSRYGRVDLDDLEGRWVAKRYDLPSPHSRGGGVMSTALPPRFVIDQRRNIIRVEDFRGRVIQEIVVGGPNRNRGNRGEYVAGIWRDSKLLTVQTAGRNTRIIQTFSLANRGRTLVVHTRQDGRGTRHDVEYTNVYQKA